jgi:hypothetical protein
MSKSNEMALKELKITVVGDRAVGKVSLRGAKSSL